MSGLLVEPRLVHGHSHFDRGDGGHRAHCLCGAFWTAPTKPEANRLLGKHLRERAREFRKLRRELRRDLIGGES